MEGSELCPSTLEWTVKVVQVHIAASVRHGFGSKVGGCAPIQVREQTKNRVLDILILLRGIQVQDLGRHLPKCLIDQLLILLSGVDGCRHIDRRKENPAFTFEGVGRESSKETVFHRIGPNQQRHIRVQANCEALKNGRVQAQPINVEIDAVRRCTGREDILRRHRPHRLKLVRTCSNADSLANCNTKVRRLLQRLVCGLQAEGRALRNRSMEQALRKGRNEKTRN
mmetsp:Transcript_14927/g.37949  ORF Transcript_14927/g.37949 Transcript_14927/m.37949 type:complete len:226 (+) Transcript_14927:853-1530(+)